MVRATIAFSLLCVLSGPALAELREETGQTVALAVWANHGATIVRWLGADTPVSASLRVGAVMPLTRSASPWRNGSSVARARRAPAHKQA